MVPQFQVQTPELALAAAGIGRVAAEVQAAGRAVRSAESEAGAFGGEPIGSAFLSMCGAASRAAGEYGQATDALARNVAMASLGYVTTDEGIIPTKLLGSAGRNP